MNGYGLQLEPKHVAVDKMIKVGVACDWLYIYIYIFHIDRHNCRQGQDKEWLTTESQVMIF
jgi:hypothetical protein